MNRNERPETLIMYDINCRRAGCFSLIISGDSFSDRAMKAISRLVLNKE
jgi:hypothetical protein